MSGSTAPGVTRAGALNVTRVPEFPRAACIGHADLFTGEVGSAQAKTLCASCDHLYDCAAYALNPANNVTAGIWAGMTTAERDAIKTQRRKARKAMLAKARAS